MIPLGIVIPLASAPLRIPRLAADGFEAVSLYVWEDQGADRLGETLAEACAEADKAGLPVSCLSVYGNPLRADAVGETTRSVWTSLVDEAGTRQIPVVSGFAGRVVGAGVEESLPAWKAFFGPLADQAEAAGTRIAFENCRLGDTWKTGKWNIAINPDAWDLLFSSLDAPHLGLEWEPCHQLEALADPHEQLEAWAHRVVHVHGKDAQIDRQALARQGFYAKGKWHRSVLPGRGDADWGRLLATLERAGYRGTVDLENPAPADQPSDEGLQEELASLRYLQDHRPS